MPLQSVENLNLIKKISVLLPIGIFVFGCVPDEINNYSVSNTEKNIFINEIYSTGNPDWFEIYNRNSEAVDLSGFFIYDEGTLGNPYALPSGTQIDSKSFLIIQCNDEGIGLNSNFKLSSSGETIFLENSDGNLIDEVSFPTLSDGQSYGRTQDGENDFAILETPTQGFTNQQSSEIQITSVDRFPNFPTPEDTVKVFANVKGDGISQIFLIFKKQNTGFQKVEMVLVNGKYSAEILPTNSDQTINFYIEAIDENSQSYYEPSDAPNSYFSYTISTTQYIPPQLFINEVLASNSLTNQDPDFNAFGDWLEIYNAENIPVDISGMFLTDESNAPMKWEFPENTIIEANGFLLVWTDDNDTSGMALHTNFKLSSSNGETIKLFDTNAHNNILLDSLTFDSQSADISFGRKPDGSEILEFFNTPSPSASNN